MNIANNLKILYKCIQFPKISISISITYTKYDIENYFENIKQLNIFCHLLSGIPKNKLTNNTIRQIISHLKLFYL